MAELLSTNIPTVESAPRGLNHPDNYAPLYRDAEASIDQDDLLDTIIGEIPEDERHVLVVPPYSLETAAYIEALDRLPARLGELATQLTEQEIDRIIDEREEQGSRTPVSFDLGPVQYGFHQSETDRLSAEDINPALPVLDIGTPISRAEADDVIAKAASPTGLTSEEERRRYNEIRLARQLVDEHGNPTTNPHLELDSIARMQAQINLEAHRTGLVPARPSRFGHHRQGSARERSRRADRARARQEFQADRHRSQVQGPSATVNGYGTNRRQEVADRRAEQGLGKNDFARQGSVFRYFDENTGVERHFVVEGTHAKQATWLPAIGMAEEPVFFLNDDGSLTPVLADGSGNILNNPVSDPGNRVGRSSRLPEGLGGSTARIVTASGQQVGLTKDRLLPGREVVVYRPLFTEDERRRALRDGILDIAADDFHGAPEEITGPRYTTIDDMVIAASFGNPRPRAIERQSRKLLSPSYSSKGPGRRSQNRREEILKDEFVWQSGNEMDIEELNNPDRHPPSIIKGDKSSDYGRFIHWHPHRTRVAVAIDAYRLPAGTPSDHDKATLAGDQRRELGARDFRTRRDNRKPKDK